MKYLMYIIVIWNFRILVACDGKKPINYENAMTRAARARNFLAKKYNIVCKKNPCSSDAEKLIEDGPIHLPCIQDEDIFLGYQQKILERHQCLKRIIEEEYSPTQSGYAHYKTFGRCLNGSQVVVFLRRLNDGFLPLSSHAKSRIADEVSGWYSVDRDAALLFWKNFEEQEKIYSESAEKVRRKIFNKYL